MSYVLTHEGDDHATLARALEQMSGYVVRIEARNFTTGDPELLGDFVIKQATQSVVRLQPWSDDLDGEDPYADEVVVPIASITDVYTY